MTKVTFAILLGLFLAACTSENTTGSTKSAPKATTHQSTNNQTSSQRSPIKFTTLDPKQTGVDFVNQIDETYGRNQLTYDYFYNGGGVAIADFDNDGLADLFFCGSDCPNRIYKNKGNMKFDDLSASALPKDKRWSVGVTTVDINNDGLLDLYICNSGPDLKSDKLKNQLLINQGNFKFVDKAAEYGLDLNNYSVQAEFFDMDKDGDLDLWVNAHGLRERINKISADNGLNDIRSGNIIVNLNKIDDEAITKGKLQLFRNDDGKFVNISKAAGMNYLAFGLGLSIADYNDDGYLDVFVANDYFVPDFMFFNNQQGGFTPDISRMNHTSYYSMGTDASDYNNDGKLDLMVVDMTPKDHYRNKTLMESMDVRKFNIFTQYYKFPRAYMFNALHVGVGNGQFSEIANALDVGLSDWSWAPLFFDMDNDGYQDLYITNGYYRDSKNQDYRRSQDSLQTALGTGFTHEVAFDNLLKQNSTPIPNVIYSNVDGQQLREVTAASSDLGPTFSNGVAYGDLDNDGDLDLVINNLLEKATILQNEATQNYLSISLTANNAAQTRHTELILFTKQGIQRRDLSVTRGFLSAVEPKVHFGLGQLTSADSLMITWPNRTITMVRDLPANQAVVIDYDQAVKYRVGPQNNKTLFVEVTNVPARYNVVHKEDFYNDFDKEVLLPQKFSSLGPALAATDWNKDGMTDIYLGGSKGYPGKFMLMVGYTFREISVETFAADAAYEDIGAHFFDANGDGNMDLYVASGGGSEVEEKYLQDRLYINEKNSRLVKSTNLLPEINASTKTISSFDYDNDNDLDLFVGGRNVPGAYPDKAASYLLINNNGQFTRAELPEFYEALPNMVTDSEVADLNSDGYPDLIISGEWSYPQFFINQGGQSFQEQKHSNLTDLKGWWYSVTQGDFNKDGKVDFVFGNLGTNNKFHASAEKPLSVYFDDFDENGTQDIFLAKMYKDKLVPVRGKECSSEQMPMLNDKFKTYDAFASADLAAVLGSDKVASCDNMEVNYFKSITLISQGDGYEVIELPFEAQWAPILDAVTEDVNQDGHLDLISAGNIFNTEPETPSYDAGKGLVLLNNGKGRFKAITDISKTGLNLNMNVKQLALLRRSEGYAVLAANNNGVAQLFIRTQGIGIQ